MSLVSIVNGLKNKVSKWNQRVELFKTGHNRISTSLSALDQSYSYAMAMPFSYHWKTSFSDFVDVTDKLLDVVKEYTVYTDSLVNDPIYDILDVMDGRRRSDGFWDWSSRAQEISKLYHNKNLSRTQKDMVKDKLSQKEYFKKYHSSDYNILMNSLT